MHVIKLIQCIKMCTISHQLQLLHANNIIIISLNGKNLFYAADSITNLLISWPWDGQRDLQTALSYNIIDVDFITIILCINLDLYKQRCFYN